MSINVSFPASEMSTSLSDAHVVNIAMKASPAKEMLREAGYDQAPVVTDDRRLCGWVRTASLGGRGFVSGSLIPLDRCAIFSRDSSVGDTLHAVASSGLVFLAGPSGISEFAVTSDLDRHVVRCYLYVLVSELEMHLASQAALRLSTEEIERHLGNQRKRYEQAQERGLETNPIEYLNFSAYEVIAPQVTGIVDSFPGLSHDLPGELGKLKRLRDCVAHPSKSLTLDFEGLELARLAQLAEGFVSALRPKETRT